MKLLSKRLEYLRPIGVLFLWGLGASFTVFATIDTSPLGSIWAGANIAGAIACFALPLTHSARARAVLVGLVTFVILLHAEEWTRHVSWPLGVAMGILWVSVLIALVVTISGDAEIALEAKIRGDLE